MMLIARDEGLIKESQIDKSKWNIVKARLLKRDSEAPPEEESVPTDNPDSPTLKRK